MMLEEDLPKNNLVLNLGVSILWLNNFLQYAVRERYNAER